LTTNKRKTSSPQKGKNNTNNISVFVATQSWTVDSRLGRCWDNLNVNTLTGMFSGNHDNIVPFKM